MEIQQITGGAVVELKDEFLDVMGRTFPAQAVERKRQTWEWMCRTPHQDEANPITAIRIERDGEMIGGTFLWPIKVAFNGTLVTTRHPIGTSVDPTKRGAGLRMFRKYFQWYDLVVGNPADDDQEKIYVRLTEQEGGDLISHFKPFKPGTILARRKGLHASMLAPADWIWAIKSKLTAKRTSDYKVETITAFDAQADDLWERAYRDYGIAHKRDSDVLNWRYVDFPLYDYHLFYVHKNDQIAGYGVVRIEKLADRLNAHLTDFFCVKGDQDALDAIVKAASDVAQSNKAEQLIAKGSRECWSFDGLRKAGFPLNKYAGRVLFGYGTYEDHDLIPKGLNGLLYTRGDTDEDF